MIFNVGDILGGRYHITRRLKESPAHFIWLAKDKILERQVSIRARRPHADALTLDSFLKEAQSLAQLEHPYLSLIYDYGEQDGIQFFVTQYISGGSLEVYLRRNQPVSLDIIRLANRLASVIDFLHEHQIIHGDINPHNIFLDKHLHPYISNLFLGSSHYATKLKKALGATDERILGMLQYMAPEAHYHKKLSHYSDLYAYGMTLYQCFTRHIPLHNNEPFGLSQSSGQVDTLPSVHEYRPELPIGVDLVLRRLTHKDPEKRYQTATEAVDDLYRVFYSGQSNIEGKVFISYARKDSEYVYALVTELRRLNIDIWIDQDIEPGSNWDDSIENALNDCDMMLFIGTKDSMTSEYVTHEWSYFMGAGKPVYPFIPEGKAPDNIHSRLNRVQHIMGEDDMLNNVARIVDVLAGGNPTKLGGLDE